MISKRPTLRIGRICDTTSDCMQKIGKRTWSEQLAQYFSEDKNDPHRGLG
jgi:hypothetical protein